LSKTKLTLGFAIHDIFTKTKQSYIHYSLDVVLCHSLHVNNCVENILKHVLIRKLPESTLFYPIIGQTKTRKLLLTRLKTKHNVTVLQHHIIQFFTWKKRRRNIPFNFANKAILCELVIHWQKPPMTVKKDVLPSFVIVNALLFSILYEHTSFPYMLQPETIL